MACTFNLTLLSDSLILAKVMSAGLWGILLLDV